MEALREFLNELKTDLAMEDQERFQRDLLDRERFIKEFPQVKKELEESIRKLYALADRVDKSHGTVPSSRWWPTLPALRPVF